MSDHPTAPGGTCSGRFDPLRELFKMRRLCACLTVIALAGALPVRAEDTPAKSLAICIPRPASPPAAARWSGGVLPATANAP